MWFVEEFGFSHGPIGGHFWASEISVKESNNRKKISIISPVRRTKLILTSSTDEVGKRMLVILVFFGGLLICTYGMIRMYHMKHKHMLLSHSVHCLFLASIERTRQRKATYRVFENMVDILCRLWIHSSYNDRQRFVPLRDL